MRAACLALVVCMLGGPAPANPVLIAFGEKEACEKHVKHSGSLHVKSLRLVGADKVRVKIQRNKAYEASSKDFRTAKAAFMACMVQRLDAHSIVVE